MKIHFFGLSCFLIENKKGYRVLVDPFNDAPEWSLGIKFPKTFQNKPMGANIVLSTEPDADHTHSPGDFLEKAPKKTKPNSNPFPGLDLRGAVIYEFNGDVNIAYSYTIDGIRLAHFGDNAHILTKEQLKEIGKPDVIFMSAPKAQSEENPESLEITRKNIKSLKPKVVIWAHHLAPIGMPKLENTIQLRKFFRRFLAVNAKANKNYTGSESFLELCNILENSYILNNEYKGKITGKNFVSITPSLLKKHNKKPLSLLFKSMVAKPVKS